MVASSLVEGKMSGRILENFKIGSDKEMLRSIQGKWLVIADELSGFSNKSGEEWKAFQTVTRPSVDRKYHHIKEFPRTDWIVGTANKVFIPTDPALRSRFIICEVEARKDTEHLSPKKRGREIFEWFEKNRDRVLIGGLLLIEEDENIEADRDLWRERRESMENATNDRDFFNYRVEKALGKLTTPDHPYCRLVDVCRELDMLQYQEGKYRGSLIPRDGEEPAELPSGEPPPAVTDAVLRKAYAALSGSRGQPFRRLMSALESMGWDNRRKRINGTQSMFVCPVGSNFVEPWGIRGEHTSGVHTHDFGSS